MAKMAILGLTISTGGKNMRYTPKERVDIGKRVFTHEINKKEAAEEYGVLSNGAIDKLREGTHESLQNPRRPKPDDFPQNLDCYDLLAVYPFTRNFRLLPWTLKRKKTLELAYIFSRLPLSIKNL